VKRCWVLLAAAPASAVVVASSVVLHGAVLAAVAVGAGLAAVLACAVRDDGRAAAVEAAWKAAAFVVVVSVVTAGLGVIAGGGAAALFVLLVVAAVGLAWLRWYLRTGRFDRDVLGTGPDDDEASDSASSSVPPNRFSVPVSLLPTPALGREWQRTRAALLTARAPSARDEVVRRRQEVLDEFERRDPTGFARWLAAGAPAARGPGTFLYG
jgi:hypothetical protein